MQPEASSLSQNQEPLVPGEAAASGERREQPSVTERVPTALGVPCMCVAQVLTAHLLPPWQALGSLCSPWAAPRVGPLPPAPAMVRISKPKTFQAYLDDCHRRYSCAHCRAHLANHDDLISKSFQGSQGRAYLFNSVVNVGCGPAEERVLLTGLHAVADIHCENCKTTLGWKYEQAFESSQKYKEGKYIIELNHMIKDNGWD
ncbi:protein yippee-like 3 isoform X1 [Cebus imitator]|nr:protein yippee-like 3 isoform X1 [Cebus imitator]XP_032099004.1 protein yippee-like 3 isoform X1 [Sapajus apella]